MSDPIKEILKDTTIMAALSGDCVKCDDYRKRINEQQAELVEATQACLTQANTIAKLQSRIDAGLKLADEMDSMGTVESTGWGRELREALND